MWIGPEGNLQEFKDPATGVGDGSVTWGASGSLLNGGGWSLGGRTDHKEQSLTWNFLRGHEVSKLMELTLRGGPLSVLIGTEYQVNLLSSRLSAPGLHGYGTRVAGLGEGYPQHGAKFSESETFYMPEIPDADYQFMWWGSGAVTVGGILVPPGVPTFTRPKGREVVVGAGATVHAMRATLDTPVWEDWTYGRGNSGMSLRADAPPQITQYSAPSAVDYSAVTLTLIETGDWERVYR